MPASGRWRVHPIGHLKPFTFVVGRTFRCRLRPANGHPIVTIAKSNALSWAQRDTKQPTSSGAGEIKNSRPSPRTTRSSQSSRQAADNNETLAVKKDADVNVSGLWASTICRLAGQSASLVVAFPATTPESFLMLTNRRGRGIGRAISADHIHNI
jgi:hypothetical protein